MRISFNLDINDVLAFQSYYNENSAPFKKSLIFIRFLLPVFCILIFLIFFFKDGPTVSLYVFGLFYLAVSIWWILYIPERTKKNVLKKNRKELLKQQQNDPSSFGHREMIFADEGVSLKTSTTDFFTKWMKISRVVQYEKHFFLFLSEREALIIPLSKLSHTEIELLMDIFNKQKLFI